MQLTLLLQSSFVPELQCFLKILQIRMEVFFGLENALLEGG